MITQIRFRSPKGEISRPWRISAKLQCSLDSVMNLAQPCPGRTAMTALFLMLFIHSFAQVTKMAHVSLAADYRMSKEAKCISTPLASMT